VAHEGDRRIGPRTLGDELRARGAGNLAANCPAALEETAVARREDREASGIAARSVESDELLELGDDLLRARRQERRKAARVGEVFWKRHGGRVP
jgi:hypothetical protein